MVRKFILALLALCFANAATAQTIGGFNVPSDLTGQPGGGYVGLTPTYDTTNSAHNPSIDAGVTPPTQTGLTNVPIPSTTGRIATSNVPELCDASAVSSGFCSTVGVSCTNYGKVAAAGGSTNCTEAKFRTHADGTTYAPDDPIRNPRQPGTSHPHQFFGGGACNAYSTYKSLRTRALLSAAMGTDVNGTCYWTPLLLSKNRDGDGKDYAIKLNYAVVYYVRDAVGSFYYAETGRSTPLVPGKRYVLGFNMDDGGKPTDSDKGAGAWLQTIIAAANTANAAAGGSSTRYQIGSGASVPYYSKGHYNCVGGTASGDAAVGGGTASFLKNSDGSDPWGTTCEAGIFTASLASTGGSNGTLTVSAVVAGTTIQASTELHQFGGTALEGSLIVSQATGTAGGTGTYNITCSGTCPTLSGVAMWDSHQFFIDVNGPECWNGKDLWSPGGYKHVIPRIYDSKYSEWVCPNNYYTVPAIRLELQYTTYGAADRQKWELSSDAAARTRLSCTTAVCPPGFSFHTDWMHGWDQVQMLKWQTNCLGANHTTPHQCGSSQMNGTEALAGAAVAATSGGCGAANPPRCPQVDTTSLARYDSSGTASGIGWGKIPSAWTNSITTMHVHH